MTKTSSAKDLLSEYRRNRYSIKKRLKDFEKIHRKSVREIFPELCFCLLTPQSNARHCDRAIQELKKTGLLFKGKEASIGSILKGRARFHNKKAAYIVNARALFNKDILNTADITALRKDLVKNIKGFGYKEASHFLRNVGLGKDIAILDRHILKNLKRYGAIREIPATLTPKLYMDIEERARRFAQKIKIPLEELDLLFWSKETGEIFK